MWTPEEEATFKIVKEPIRTAPVLACPQPWARFTIDIDVSYIWFGGVLSQTQNRWEWVIAYYSKMMNKTGRTYCVTQVLTIVDAENAEAFP
jgi:hypothetical protein